MNNCYRRIIGNGNSSNNNNSNQAATLASTLASEVCDNSKCNDNIANLESLLDSLSNRISRKCICEFYIDRKIETKTGILEEVGNDYLVLKSINGDKLMYCSTCSLLFVTIIC